MSCSARLAAAALSLLCATLPLAAAATAESRRTVLGPVRAHLLRVVDGDTIEVLARIWPDHYVETLVRLADIDAPELRGRCAEEIALAERAKARLAALLGARLQLVDVHYGKYAGRVVARVLTEDGRDVAKVLLNEKLVRSYDGGRRTPWRRLNVSTTTPQSLKTQNPAAWPREAWCSPPMPMNARWTLPRISSSAASSVPPTTRLVASYTPRNAGVSPASR